MSSNDERVVSMKFDNAAFEKGVKTTLASLDALNKGLKLQGATKGLGDVSAAANNVHLGHIAVAVDNIAERFKLMSIVAITALVSVVHKAVEVGLQITKALSIAPIMSGYHEFETNINSIQTILANTAWQNTGLNDVNEALEELNQYADLTIYNFSEMARNIGTFTAAGVDLDTSVAAIKGIANLAAISGSSAQQAAAGMYQLSQALATGTLRLIDWNSVNTAGMGGKVFQDALMETARVHGVAIDKMVEDAGGFRNSLEKGWLTSDVLTETLSKFTGDLTAEQLKTMGYTDQQIAGILELGKTAQDAATKVKTFSQLIGTMQETAGSGWAKTWQIIFGDFEESKALFTGANDVLSGFIEASADARNKVLGDWKELGGRTALIEAISNAFNALLSVMRPIRDAFRQIFPATTGEQLYRLTVTIRDFTAGLSLSGSTADKLRRTFAGVFAIFGIAWDVIKGVVGVLFSLIGVVSESTGGFLNFTARIGDFLVGLREAIHNGEGLKKFFSGLATILALPIQLFQILGQALSNLFNGAGDSEASASIGRMTEAIKPMGTLGELILNLWGKLVGAIDDVFLTLLPYANKFTNFFRNIGVGIESVLGSIDFADLIGIVNTGLFAYLVSILRGLFGNDGRGGIVSGLRQNLEQLNDTLKAMQNALRAATLLQIAAAIGIIAFSVNMLSTIDSAGLSRALTAISVMFAQLFTAMIVFEKINSRASTLDFTLFAVAIGILGISLLILASVVKKLSKLSWEELTRGLAGVTILLAVLIATAKLLPNPAIMISSAIGITIFAIAIKILASVVSDLAEMSWDELWRGLSATAILLGLLVSTTRLLPNPAITIASAIGITIFAAAIKVLASAVKDMSELSWEELIRGVVGVGAAIAVVGLALKLFPASSIFSAAAILLIAVSLGMIANALESFSMMSWAEIGTGLAVLALSLFVIGAALDAMPLMGVVKAAGVLIIAVALGMIAGAMKLFGSMSMAEVGKSLLVLAGALTIITIALHFMEGALPGAFALLVVSGALVVLAGVLAFLGAMSWETILTGLAALAAVFLVIGLAGYFLTPVVPTLMAFGLAMLAIGGGVALMGLGLVLLGAGITATATALILLTASVAGIIGAIIGVVPMLVQQLGVLIIVIIDVLKAGVPALIELITLILLGLLQMLKDFIPPLGEVILLLIETVLKILVAAVPQIVDAALKIIEALLRGLANGLPGIIDAAGDLIIAFLDGIAEKYPEVIDGALKALVTFMDGFAKAIEDNSEEIGKSAGNLAKAIIKGMVTGLKSGVGEVIEAAKSVAKSALNAAKDWLGISSPSKEFALLGMYSDQGLADGLVDYAHLVSKAGEDVGKRAVDSVRGSLKDLSSAVDGDIDLTPVISPVLDLTDVKRSAGELDGMLTAKPISLEMTRSYANDAASGYEANADAAAEFNASSGDTFYNFTQNNNSPKALSEGELYRQTKNQLSVVKKGAEV